MTTNCPFTFTEYRNLIRMAKSRFQIIDYPDYPQHDSFIIWRHDVEYSVDEMNKLAVIDAEEGIQSTFFLQLHSETYNFWSREVVDKIKQWLRMAHRLGLHFDANYYGIKDSHNLGGLIQRERMIIEEIYETPVSAFAYHSPTPEILRCSGNYGGLVNTYNADFFGGKVIYVSDSNGRWRERTIRDVLEAPTTTMAQINTHDTWWTDERIPQIQKLENVWRRQAEHFIQSYRKNAHIVVNEVL